MSDIIYVHYTYLIKSVKITQSVHDVNVYWELIFIRD